jgi:hypothetical protein
VLDKLEKRPLIRTLKKMRNNGDVYKELRSKLEPKFIALLKTAEEFIRSGSKAKVPDDLQEQVFILGLTVGLEKDGWEKAIKSILRSELLKLSREYFIHLLGGTLHAVLTPQEMKELAIRQALVNLDLALRLAGISGSSKKEKLKPQSPSGHDIKSVPKSRDIKVATMPEQASAASKSKAIGSDIEPVDLKPAPTLSEGLEDLSYRELFLEKAKQGYALENAAFMVAVAQYRKYFVYDEKTRRYNLRDGATGDDALNMAAVIVRDFIEPANNQAGIEPRYGSWINIAYLELLSLRDSWLEAEKNKVPSPTLFDSAYVSLRSSVETFIPKPIELAKAKQSSKRLL